MRIAKVCLVAPIASFRYPHFLVGRQVSYDMPPPSTIYGHIASAVGAWPEPAALQFAYWISHTARGVDLEHQHIISRYPAEKMSRAEAARFKVWRQTNEFSVGGTVQPVGRDFLFGVTLTLYLAPAELVAAFRRPAFPVVLGRSQDLACVVSVEEVELEEAPAAYFSGTLLPFAWRSRTALGTTVLMPRYISPPPERQASFAQYIALAPDRTVLGGRGDGSGRKWLLRSEASETWPVDPTSDERDGLKRGLVWHSFVDA